MTTQQPKSLRILLVGDDCTDVYQYGIVERLSPEAPVPVFVPTHKEIRRGMAGNVSQNLKALGCDVQYLFAKTSVKTRLIDQRSNQHIARIDNDEISEPLSFVSEIPRNYDAIVVSDYNKGTVTYELIEELIETKIPVFVDTKKTDLERLQGAWVKINSTEYRLIKSECTGLIVTLGDKGAKVIYHDIEYPAPKVEISDVCGAGDTFLAALAYNYCQTGSIDQAVQFAIKAASITVQHLGNYAPTLEEIK